MRRLGGDKEAGVRMRGWRGDEGLRIDMRSYVCNCYFDYVALITSFNRLLMEQILKVYIIM